MFTHDETHELDAAVMDGATLRAGAVGCVTRVRRPVRAARAVMEHSDHVLLVGAAVEALAQKHWGWSWLRPIIFRPMRGASNCTGRWPPTRPCWTMTQPRS